MHDSRAMPTPMVRIGMAVQPFPLSAYQRRRILRAQITEHLRIGGKLRKTGYMKRTPGDMTILGKHAKEMVRAFMHVIDNAHTVEVAGIHGEGHHLGLSPVNECYVGGGTGWSGMDFHPQLLWRASVDGKELVVLQPAESVRFCFRERDIVKAAIPADAAA